MVFLLAVVLSFLPALLCAWTVYSLDWYEKEPRVLLGAVFFWGAVVAVLGAVVAQTALEGAVHVATGSASAGELAGTTLFAPLTEESLKGFAVLLVFLFLRREFDSILDGIVYGAVTALGFAATENVFYIWGAAAESGMEGFWTVFALRVGLGAWDHPFYTSFIGIGLALSRLSRSTAVRWLAPPAGWGAAVFAHSLHNTLATFAGETPALFGLMLLIDWSGWLLISGLIFWSIRREGRLLRMHLAEEVEQGRLTPDQYHTAASTWAQALARLGALASGRLCATRRLYQTCGELAHKKHQLACLGEEPCNANLVEALRAELASLSSQVAAERRG